ncbi:MAG: gluconolactonase [Defluviitaleaceae bacterium]|nr:gluconolactonase [Defluviitaleaceae bacterium]
MLKRLVALTLAVLIVSAGPTVFADTPFQGYTYNFWGTLVPSPAAYVPVRSFGLHNICAELGDMADPTDLHVDPEDNVYIVDWGNDRIVVFDMDLNLIRVIDGYYRDGIWVENGLNRPHGVFVTDDMEIFIADELNNRVVILKVIDDDVHFLREILSPEVEGLEDDFDFLPMNVLVDRGGRVFVIVRHVFEGIMSFSADGEFIGYFGTIEVSFSWIDMFWRMFLMTQAQIDVDNAIIPREFRSMDIDQYGFVFTTHIENWHLNNQVMRLNPRGEDVLVNFNLNVTINGDQVFREAGPMSGMSVFIDVIARSHGKYSALCSTRGRIYTYDSEGNLLYVFGGTGSLEGMTRMPRSIEIIGDDILLLDADGRGRIIHYAPTEYGRLVNTAIALRYDGHDRQAVEYWRQLVMLDENFALAWSGIGRSLLAAGYNADAMEYLRQGMDVRYFSIAFRRNRLDVMQGALPNIFTAGSVLVVLFVAYKIFYRVKFGKEGEDDV